MVSNFRAIILLASHLPNFTSIFRTLQELIAPKSVIFYSKGWVELGRRSELASVISRITRIDEGILTRMQDLKYVSVSKRMSWASDRQTGRPEDIAYCLMGIFDVNMAMLYGEGGEKAFRRLQEEIMKDSDDETLFAWSNTRHAQPELQGLLATSPADFRNSSHYIPDYDRGAGAPNSITSKGLCINLGLQLLEDDIWIGALECPVPPMYEESLAIYLKRLDKQGQQYARVKADRLCKIPQKGPVQTIYVRQHPLIPGFDDVLLHHVFQLRKAQICEKGSAAFRSLAEQGYYLVETAAPSLGKEIEPLPTSAPNWIPTSCKKTFQIPRGAMRLASALMFKRSDGTDVIVMLGSKPGFGIAVDVVPYEDIAKRKSRKTKTLSLILDDHAEGLLDLNFQELEDSFNPQSPGEWFHLGPDSFRIDIQPRTRAGMRYYMVDIWIERTPTLTPEDLLSLPVVGGFVAGLPSLDPEIVSARSGKPSDGKGRRWKNPFKPSRN